MKKTKLLFLVLAVPLLIGCGGSAANKTAKSPKFAKEGEKVEGADFLTKVNDAFNSCAFAKDDLLGSAVAVIKEAGNEKSELVRGGKKVESAQEYGEVNYDVKYDAEHSILRMNAKMTEAEESDNGNTKTSVSAKQEMNRSYEGAQVNGANHLVLIDLNEKSYASEELISGDKTVAKELDSYVKMMMGMMAYSTFMSPISSYATMSEEQKAKFNFYQTGNVFTYTYEDKVENNEVKEDETVVRVENESVSKKYQLDFTEGKMALRTYSEEIGSVEYKVATGEYGVGDIAKEEEKAGMELTYTTKKVSLKNTDLSKFTAIGF